MSHPSLHPPLGSPFIELQSVDSTNNYALGQIHAGLAQAGTAFFAHEQRQGKGQRGKTWQAATDSSVILSMIVNPKPLQVSQQFQLSACAAVSVHEFFRKYAGDSTCIKWPNDLYWNDRKAGGILIENIIRGQQSRAGDWQYAVVGTGININQAGFAPELRNPVSLRQITGKSADPVVLAKEICRIFHNNLQTLLNEGFQSIYAHYLGHLYKKDQAVKLKKENRVFEAIIRGVTPSGSLRVQHAFEEEFSLGEVEWQIPSS